MRRELGERILPLRRTGFQGDKRFVQTQRNMLLCLVIAIPLSNSGRGDEIGSGR